MHQVTCSIVCAFNSSSIFIKEKKDKYICFYKIIFNKQLFIILKKQQMVQEHCIHNCCADVCAFNFTNQQLAVIMHFKLHLT